MYSSCNKSRITAVCKIKITCVEIYLFLMDLLRLRTVEGRPNFSCLLIKTITTSCFEYYYFILVSFLYSMCDGKSKKKTQ